MRARGFTLIEMLVVLAMMGVLAAAARPMLQMSAQRTREHELRIALRQIRTGIDAYKKAADEGEIAKAADASGYPPTLETLVNGVQDAKSPKEHKLYFLRRVPRDPFADPTTEPAQTWQLRSADSPPDEPRPGADVYDVRSRSDKRALDGSRYKDW